MEMKEKGDNTGSKKKVFFGVIAVTIAILYIAATFNQKTFGSPDEAGNDFFIRHLASTGQYSVATPLTAEQLFVLDRKSTRLNSSH